MATGATIACVAFIAMRALRLQASALIALWPKVAFADCVEKLCYCTGVNRHSCSAAG
jgi:hypothetical protein